ncbi:MAG: hypothetical protein V1787_02665 [Candidatus Micrarchaeota archaeon]
MKKRIFLVAVFAVAMLFVQPPQALMASECADASYRMQNADAIVTGTISYVQYTTRDSDMTVVTLYPFEWEKKPVPNATDPANQGPRPGVEFYVLGGVFDGYSQIVEDMPQISPADVGKQVRVELRKDDYGSYTPFCGESGYREMPVPSLYGMPVIPDDGQPYSFTVNLKPGWNLFSSPVYYDGNPVCPPGIAPCPLTGIPPMWKIKENTCGDVNVWHYNVNSKSYDRRTLEDMTRSFVYVSDGFWTKAKNACRIVFEGNRRVETMNGVSLQPGWNQLGAGYTAENAVGLLSSCSVTSGPYYYDNPQRKWVKATRFEPGRGYFVKVSSGCFLGGKPSLNDVSPYREVEFGALVGQPWKYDGENVCVNAYHVQSFEYSALVGSRPETTCTHDYPSSYCSFKFSDPGVWMAASEFEPLGEKMEGSAGSSYLQVLACGKFEYSATPTFGHLGAYKFQLSDAV